VKKERGARKLSIHFGFVPELNPKILHDLLSIKESTKNILISNFEIILPSTRQITSNNALNNTFKIVLTVI